MCCFRDAHSAAQSTRKPFIRRVLKSIPAHQRICKVPKKRRLEFLISEDHNSITRKSKAHYAMIEAVASKPRRSRKTPKQQRKGTYPVLGYVPFGVIRFATNFLLPVHGDLHENKIPH